MKPVWEGLAHLDHVERMVKGGYFVQETYRTIQPVLVQPEAAPTLPKVNIESRPAKTAQAIDLDTLSANLKALRF